MNRCSNPFTSLPTLVLFWVFDNSHPYCCKAVYITVVLICISLMMSDIWALFHVFIDHLCIVECFPCTICWKYCPFPINSVSPLVKNHLTLYVRFISKLSILFQWSVCLSLCQYHTESMNPPTLFFFFKIVLAICSLLRVYMNLRMNFSIYAKISLRFW